MRSSENEPVSEKPLQSPDSVQERCQGRIFPTEISAEIEIDAPAAMVWQVLTDFERYGEWNSFTPGVTSDFRLGSPVEMQVRLVPGKKLMRQVETMNVLEPGRRFAYGYDLGSRYILRANRYQIVDDLGAGRSRYYTTDKFSGVLVPLMNSLYARHIKRGFEDVATGLKTRVESQARSTQKR